MDTLATTILVATDFSRASELAIDAAALLARQNHATLTLAYVHLADAPSPLWEGVVPAGSTIEDPARAEAHLQLDALAKRKLGDFADIRVTVIVSSGVVDGLCNYAKHLNADLIVISTHGRTGLPRVLLGSVAEGVVRHAPCPVLSLRTKAS